MDIKTNISLKKYNTFRVDIKTKQFCEIINIQDLIELYNQNLFSNKFLILGGGSNILFTKDYDGMIIKMNILGRKILEETDSSLKLKLGAGEIFEDIVEWSIKNSWMGIQNLAMIPGTVGATPIQNVGAYGVEIKDVLEEIEYFDSKDGNTKKISAKDCNFGYRDSIFKQKLKDDAIVTSITIRLEKYKGKKLPERYLAYGDITNELENKYKKPYTLENLYEAIFSIRKSKLPDLKEYGSCGSTFQNPIISQERYSIIKEKYENIPSFPTGDKNLVKIPAAYVLEKLGWKNKRIGKCGTWTHPLIVTNYEGASSEEILSVIEEMQKDFYDDLGVELKTEINII